MIHPDRILLAVCKAFCVDPQAVWGPSRIRSVSQPRMVAAYLMRELTDMSLQDIALYLNRKDHSTCWYYIATVKEMMRGEVYQSFVTKIQEDIAKDGRSSTPAPNLQSSHPILREGSRHSRRGHGLQWLLQRLPSESLAEPCEADGESGADSQTNEST